MTHVHDQPATMRGPDAMIDARIDPVGDARPQAPIATHGRRWLHTVELGVVFVLLAMLAEAAGFAHEETAARVHGQVAAIAARPATR